MFGKRKKRREAIRNKLREKSEYKMKSENVAIPEIHTKDFDEIEEHIDEIEQEKEEKHSILYDNVAIPEVHIMLLLSFLHIIVFSQSNNRSPVIRLL